VAVLVILGIGASPSVSANVSYASSAALVYGIAISQTSNPVFADSSGLSILGTYQQLTDSSSSYVVLSGDGSYQTVSPNPASMPVSDTFTAEFNSNGASAAFGTVDSLQTGLFGLLISNNGPFAYELNITLNYQLAAEALGVYANTSTNLDYWDDGGLNSGYDFVTAASFPAQLHDQENTNGTTQWHIFLAAGAIDSLFAQVGVESHLDTTTFAAVPIPGAAWLFSLGLMCVKVFLSRNRISAGATP
jgi:hypothetical protein